MVTRIGDATSPLTANYHVSGTAGARLARTTTP